MRLNILLNSSQRKALSQFFNNIAVGWFVAAFVTPNLASQFQLLTLIGYLINMIGALYISLWFINEEE